MLKNFPFPTLAVFSLCAAIALAQEAPSAEKTPAAPQKKADQSMPVDSNPAGKPKPSTKPVKTETAVAPVPEIVAEPTPRPKKPSFFRKLFGGRKSKATPTPAPTPSPTPRRSVRKPAATPSPEPGSTPKLDQTSAVKIDRPIKAADTPVKKIGTTKPAVTEPRKPAIEPPADADPDVKEKFRFEQAKIKAADDPQVKSLKAKADDASTDEESRKALRIYNKALFDKIRKIDSSVSERADRFEAAILKRLSE
jgi:hypothetical protein